ncbi:hypothetical protein HDU76_009294 [Blyttiomyces sp. JEL0837]|nr:hypothetical protein HDU76_009294 [Blyttiomyces sp. JEL0837]
MEICGLRDDEIEYEASQRVWEEQLGTVGKGLDYMIAGYWDDEVLSELINAVTSVTNALFLDSFTSYLYPQRNRPADNLERVFLDLGYFADFGFSTFMQIYPRINMR